MKKDIPIKKNEHHQLRIDNIGSNGEGIGRIEGFTVFIEGALPGELVEARIIKVAKNYGVGKLIQIIEKSQDRVEPLCPYFTRCGGCQFQHLNYEAQLKYKAQTVRDCMERIAKLEGILIHPVIGMENPWEYRNKAQFPVGLTKDTLAVGLYAKMSHDIVDMDKCAIQHGLHGKINEIVRRFMVDFLVSPYREENHEGLIRHIVIKTGFSTGELMVIIVTNGREIPHHDQLVSRLREGVEGIKSIVQNINTRRTNVILGDINRVLWGQEYITEKIGELSFKISPMSFFQVNPAQTEKLYGKALEYAALIGSETVFDVYCGIGTISLFLAQKASKVYGVEVVEQAIEDAKENARINGIENIEFLAGQAEVLIPQLLNQGIKPDVIVLDPPRKGCDEELLQAIAKVKPERIVYVSCNPATLARDLRILHDQGYHAEEIQPVDMFPQTGHVETVVLMSRVDK